MKTKFAIAVTASVLAIPGVAAAAGGPMILGGTYGPHGVSVPGSEYRYAAITTGSNGVLAEQITTDGGVIKRYEHLDGAWSLPAVTYMGQADGLSADGQRLALISPAYDDRGRRTGSTSFLILEAEKLKVGARLSLEGVYSFDAISPDGRYIYLVEYPHPRDPFDYVVRRFDVATKSFVGGPIVDPDNPDEKMTGQPLSRVASPDGAWAYTLYGGGEETFVHALNTVTGNAECIDLEAIDPRKVNPYELSLHADPDTGVLTVTQGRMPVEMVDTETLTAHDAPGPAVAEAVVAGAGA